MTVRTLRALGLAIALAVLPGCLAPPIALPPPEALVADFSSGVVTITGTANPGAYVSAFDERAMMGVIVRADSSGHFTLMLAAMTGDGIQVWQEVSTVRSGPTDLCVGTCTVADH